MAIDPNNLAGTAHLTFDDEFSSLGLWNGTSGTWDTNAAWEAVNTNGYSLNSNGEQEWYINNNYAPTSSVTPWTVSNGVLNLTGAQASPAIQGLIDGYQYTSGQINTSKSFSQEYGYFEVNAKLPSGQGFWPAFWLLPENGGWPPELDVMEMLGNNTSTYYTTVHYNSDNESQSQAINTGVDLSAGFHTYGVDWEPDHITWYLDGKQVYQVATPADMNTPMYMILNLALGGSWPGDVNASTHLPNSMQVDWVRVYADGAASTGGSGGGSTTGAGTGTATGTGTGTATGTGATGQSHPAGALGADFNGDGYADFLWMNASTHQFGEWQGGSGGFNQSAYTAAAPSGWALAAQGDFNGDGRTDLAWFNPTSHAVSEWQSNGSAFSQNTFYANVPAGWSLAGAADFNGDGKSDLVWFNSSAHAVSEWQSTGSGFTQNTFYADVPAGWSVAGHGDFNGDGASDLLWFNSQTNAVSEWRSTGSGFAQNTFYANVPAGWSVAGVGDFNGDGKGDLLWFNSQTNAVSEWQSNGSGFTQNTFYTGIPAGWSIGTVGDFNHDGKADILWSNAQSHAVSLWTSTGSGFEQNTYYADLQSSGSTVFDPTHASSGDLYLL